MNDDFHLFVILAPSGSGKSYYAMNHPRDVVDGDRIVAASIGWPPGRWWDGPPHLVAHVHTRNQRAIEQWAADTAAADEPRIVLFNGRWQIEDDWETQHNWVSVVMPPLNVHLENVERRRLAHPGGVQPTDRAEIARNRIALSALAAAHTLPVFESFLTAVWTAKKLYEARDDWYSDYEADRDA